MDKEGMLQKLLDEYKCKGNPKYISNEDLRRFFDKEQNITYEDFLRIQRYFNDEIIAPRSVFREIDKRLKAMVVPASGIRMQNRFRECMILRRYSAKTIKAYSDALVRAHGWFQKNMNMPIDRINSGNARDYFMYLMERKKASVSAIRMYRFAIHLYFTEILKKSIDMSYLDGMKTKRKLPEILTRDEVARIIGTMRNIKHRTIIALIYASGLRLSECINLRVRDIDMAELTIHVKNGKGGKDRITVFSASLRDGLTYCMTDKRPGDFVFTSAFENVEHGTSRLSARTVQSILERAAAAAGIIKHVTPHLLRHAFATHLLENGVSIRYIQSLLGHRNIATTTIYTSVARPSVKGIKSPLP